MSKAKMVTKSNSLIEASYDLNLVPQRLIILAIIEAREKCSLIDAQGIIKVSAQDYVKHFDVNRVTAYEVLETACVELFDSKFIWKSKDEKGNIKRNHSRFVQRASYVDAAGYIEIMFSEDIMPLITQLSERYTQYDLKQIGNLQSSYSLRIFEMLMQWISVGKTPFIKLEDFRERLGIGNDKYDSMSDFKKRVLDPAIKEISKNTNITVSYQQKKEGVKITGFSFIFKDKKLPKKATKNANKNIDSTLHKNVKKIGPLNKSQIEMFGDKLYKYFDFKRDVMGQDREFMGKSEAECKAHIKIMLKDPNMTARWGEYLYQLGYEPPKKQAS